MQATTVHPGHYVRAIYHGPTETKEPRYTLSWEGWARTDRRVMRRVKWMEPAELAATAGEMFAAWLSDDTPGRFVARSVNYAGVGPCEWAFIVHCDEVTA